ncbi:MAG TPA: glycosyltransferase family 39 protein [Kofleriaceae bacterium]|nr:glycosyltransferase family 39 protein [Kofleriaceae bacterium]
MQRARAIAPYAIAVALIAILVGIRACATPAQRTSGFIDLPRGGPYILGFETRGTAKLEVAGHVITGPSQEPDPVKHDAGVTYQRIVLPAGPAPFTLTGDARLIWHPPGRRGSPEYVPSSSLSPDQRFGGGSGAARTDGMIVVAIVLVIAALAIYLCRARIVALDKRDIVAFGACFVLALAARGCGLGDAGQTWDEDEYWSSGRNDVQNVLALDFAPDAWVWNYEHPPVTKYLAGAGALWSDGFGPARALSALVMALGCALLVPIGTRLFSRRAGIFAAVFAALSPHLIAHGQIIGHEAPTVFLWALAIWLSLRAHDEPKRLAWRLVGIGVVVGLALMTRFVNALVAIPIAAALVAYAPRADRARVIKLGAILIPIAALVTCFLIWPRLWSHPIAHLQEALAKTGKLHDPEPFFGVLTAEPPRWCFAVYVFACTPILLFVAALAFAPRARTWRPTAVALAWLLGPLVVAFSPVRQDGVRYVLPSLTAIALLAGAAIDQIAKKWIAEAIAAALALYLAITCVRVAPYYLDYYSEAFGGPSGVAADQRFVISWWGEGVDDAVAYVNAHAAPGARVHRDCAVPSHVTWFRGDLWDAMVRDPAQADWIVWTQPSWRRCGIPPNARLTHTTSVLGAPLAYVYEVDHTRR